MRRREFIAFVGSTAVARPLAARAQQPAMPVIGFLSSASPGPFSPLLAAFLAALREAGYFEGSNVVIEYRWAEGQYDRLPAMAADLVRHKVAVNRRKRWQHPCPGGKGGNFDNTNRVHGTE